MLNSEIGRYQLEDQLRRAHRERIAASLVKASSPRRLQRLSTALLGIIRAPERPMAPSPATSPARGPGSAVFTLTWGFGTPALDHVLEMQIEHPGGSVVHRDVGTSDDAGTFTGAEPGVYRLRSRVRNLSTGTKTDWSPAASITIM